MMDQKEFDNLPLVLDKKSFLNFFLNLKRLIFRLIKSRPIIF